MDNINIKVSNSRNPKTVNDVIEIILENRNMTKDEFNITLEDIEKYVNNKHFIDGAKLFIEHIQKKSRILICGDYDCDGTTSVAQFKIFMDAIGYQNFEIILPDRFLDGYGIPKFIKNMEAELVLSVDCGTVDIMVQNLRQQNKDVIVVDHHEAEESHLAHPNVLINPKVNDPDAFDIHHLCASGLTTLFLKTVLKILQESNMINKDESIDGRFYALSAIGTVADIVPMKGVNRVITKTGLLALNSGVHKGLESLRQLCGIDVGKISAGHIGFRIGPHINAAGRMDNACLAYHLLSNDKSYEDTYEYAEAMNFLNVKRQNAEQGIVDDIVALWDSESRSIVAYHPDWSAGIVGICASRVQEKALHGLVIVLQEFPEKGYCKGSVRSVNGVSAHTALSLCDDILVKWGGHEMAAGLTIETQYIPELRKRIENYCQSLDAKYFLPSYRVDCVLNSLLINPLLYKKIEELAPHGPENPAPVFLTYTEISRVRFFGKEKKYAEYTFNSPMPLRGIDWNADGTPIGIHGDQVTVLYKIGWDDYNNTSRMDIIKIWKGKHEF